MFKFLKRLFGRKPKTPEQAVWSVNAAPPDPVSTVAAKPAPKLKVKPAPKVQPRKEKPVAKPMVTPLAEPMAPVRVAARPVEVNPSGHEKVLRHMYRLLTLRVYRAQKNPEGKKLSDLKKEEKVRAGALAAKGIDVPDGVGQLQVFIDRYLKERERGYGDL